MCNELINDTMLKYKKITEAFSRLVSIVIGLLLTVKLLDGVSKEQSKPVSDRNYSLVHGTAYELTPVLQRVV